MKQIKLAIVLLALGGIISNGCKKENGFVGKKHVSGTVTYKNGASGTNDAAPGALVHIAFGSTGATTTYNQTVVADASGNYTVDGLAKGDYFFTGEFTDSHGYKYSSAGYSVTIKDKKKDLQVDIALQ